MVYPMVSVSLFTKDGEVFLRHVNIPPTKLGVNILQDGGEFFIKDMDSNEVYYKQTHFDVSKGWAKHRL